MGESLIQQCRVSDESLFGFKALSSKKIMTVFGQEVLANSVPAAAVIRKGLALFRIIGRKEHVDGLLT